MVGDRLVQPARRHLMYFGVMAMASQLTARVWLTGLPRQRRRQSSCLPGLPAPVAGLASSSLLPTRASSGAARRSAARPVRGAAGDGGPGRPAHLYPAVRLAAHAALEILAALVVYLRVTFASRRANEFWVAFGILACSRVLIGAQSWRRQPYRPRRNLARAFGPSGAAGAGALAGRLVQVFAGALRSAEAGRSTLESRIQEAALTKSSANFPARRTAPSRHREGASASPPTCTTTSAPSC